MKAFKAVLLLLLFVVMVVFIVENQTALSQGVSFYLDFYLFKLHSGELPLFLLLLVFLALGGLLSYAHGLYHRTRLKRENRELKRMLDEKTDELNALRNLPVVSESVPIDEQAGKA